MLIAVCRLRARYGDGAGVRRGPQGPIGPAALSLGSGAAAGDPNLVPIGVNPNLMPLGTAGVRECVNVVLWV